MRLRFIHSKTQLFIACYSIPKIAYWFYIRRMWIKKFLNVNIINFEKVDKPEGGGSDNVNKVILLNYGTF